MTQPPKESFEAPFKLRAQNGAGSKKTMAMRNGKTMVNDINGLAQIDQ